MVFKITFLESGNILYCPVLYLVSVINAIAYQQIVQSLRAGLNRSTCWNRSMHCTIGFVTKMMNAIKTLKMKMFLIPDQVKHVLLLQHVLQFKTGTSA